MDFILFWVDGNDPEWLNSFKENSKLHFGEQRDMRFREWDNLHFWFRGIEKFAPWVNKIHFVTCGHYPDWLNINHPKLNLVKHSDYIPEKYLPTFNSSVIEMFFNRIEGLSEEFVLFNDDFFLINEVNPSRFFQKGLPCDIFASNTLTNNEAIGHTILNNIGMVNQFHSKHSFLKKDFTKYFNYKYGSYNLRSLFLSFWPNFTGFVDPHFPQPYLKSTFEEVWGKGLFSDKNFSRFRDFYNYSQYVMRYWHLAKGEFYPYNIYKDSIYYTVDDSTLVSVCHEIESQKKSIIILNDSEDVDFEVAKNKINDSFQIILPEKSSFEV